MLLEEYNCLTRLLEPHDLISKRHRFVKKFMARLEEKGFFVSFERKLAEYIKKTETVFVRFGDNVPQRLGGKSF